MQDPRDSIQPGTSEVGTSAESGSLWYNQQRGNNSRESLSHKIVVGKLIIACLTVCLLSSLSYATVSGGKRFVNSFKRRAFLAHIVESALPTHIDPSRWKNDETCQVSGVCFYRPSKRRAADELSSRAFLPKTSTGLSSAIPSPSCYESREPSRSSCLRKGINRGITRVMPLLVDPIQTDLVYVQESEGVLSLGEGIVLLAFLLVELWVFLFFFLVPSCAKQASLSFLAQVTRRPAENAKLVIHTQSESNFLAEESQKGSSASSPFNRATAFLRLRPPTEVYFLSNLSPNEVPTSVLVPRSDVTTSLSKSIRDSQRSEGEARTNKGGSTLE
ncbi:hypothetical protein QL285_097550 [Trifolium repens]|nr:hypothetical protein QL285_097550 [Trifolium repens]